MSINIADIFTHRSGWVFSPAILWHSLVSLPRNELYRTKTPLLARQILQSQENEHHTLLTGPYLLSSSAAPARSLTLAQASEDTCVVVVVVVVVVIDRYVRILRIVSKKKLCENTLSTFSCLCAHLSYSILSYYSIEFDLIVGCPNNDVGNVSGGAFESK